MIRDLSAPLGALLLLLASAAPLAAQQGAAPAAASGASQVVRGIVRDRVMRDAPLSGADVVVLGTAFATVTNDKGEFSLVLPAGTHSFVAIHPVFDSLGLGEIEREYEIRAGATPPLVELQTPTLAEFQQAQCGRTLAEGQGILLGTVSLADESAAVGATLRARWGVRRLTYRETDIRTDSVEAVTNDEGGYVLCGVPQGEAAAVESLGVAAVRGRVTLSALGTAGRAGPLLMEQMLAHVVRRDLVIGGESRTSWIEGRLLTESGEPVRGGRVVSRSDSTLVATADSTGRFRLRVPRRSDQLIVRAVGRMPLQVELAVVDDDHDLGDLEMPEAAQQLEAVTVVGAGASMERRAFDERRSLGMGSFLDDDEIKRMPRVGANVVASRVRGASVVQVAPSDRRFVLQRNSPMGPAVCAPRFFIDGSDLGNELTGSEQEFFFEEAVRIEVYSAQQAPARYTDFDGCGVVVLWTR